MYYITIETKCNALHFKRNCDKVASGDKMKNQIKSSLLLILATIIWGSAFVSQKLGMDHIGPFTFQAVRSFLAVIGLLPIIYLLDKRDNCHMSYFRRWMNKKLWLGGILCGIPLFLACNLQQVGLVDTDSGKSAFLTAMYIVLVPIIGIFRRKKPSPIIPVSVALAVFGLYALTGANGKITISDLLLIGCAVMFSLQITFVDIFAPDVDALRLNTIQVLICSVLSAVVMIFTETPTWEGIGKAWIPLAHTGFLSMGAAYSLQIVGQKHLEPSTASLIMSLESVFALLFGWLILGDWLTGWETVGCICIFIAVILSQIPVKKKSTV